MSVDPEHLAGTLLRTTKSSPTEPVAPMSEFERGVALLLRAENRDPFRLLGPHIVDQDGAKQMVARAFLPRASEVSVVLEGQPGPIAARRISPEGFFEVILPLSRAL